MIHLTTYTMFAALAPPLAESYTMFAALAPPLAEELARVRARRRIKSAGLAAGGGLIGAASLVVAAQQPEACAPLVAGAAAVGAALGRDSVAWALAAPPETAPLDGSSLAVRAAGAKGDGLFAAAPIADGTYLLDYVGEVIDEAELYARYGDPADPRAAVGGAYVFELADDVFVDGADPDRSNLARYMNHAPAGGANVRRERLGGPLRLPGTRCDRGVRFFAKRDIAAGEELCFDYGADYWAGKEAPS